MNSIKAVIPVRAGSQRAANKNIRPFANSSLLELKIKQLLRISGLDEVCVNSESEEMLEMAVRLGATPIKRDPHFSTDDCSINDVWENIAQTMDCDHVLYTNVTNPLVKDETYQKCIQKYMATDMTKSLNTVTGVRQFLWSNGKPVNYDPDNQPRSQDLPNMYHPNFAINLIGRRQMQELKCIFTRNFIPFRLGKLESIDIDDEEDFRIAEILYGEMV